MVFGNPMLGTQESNQILKVDVFCAKILVSGFFHGNIYCHDQKFIIDTSIHLELNSECLLNKTIVPKQISQFIQKKRIVS